MPEHSIKLIISPRPSTIEVNGIDIAEFVTDLRFTAKAAKVPELQVTLKLPTARIEALGNVALPANLQALLESLGWTPPEND